MMVNGFEVDVTDSCTQTGRVYAGLFLSYSEESGDYYTSAYVLHAFHSSFHLCPFANLQTDLSLP